MIAVFSRVSFSAIRSKLLLYFPTYSPAQKSFCASALQSVETEFAKKLRSKIKLSGPLTVAEYMQEVLCNPSGGYYMSKDVFGLQGDFTTSPEISQIFGELIGVWFYNQWIQLGSPSELMLVEFGPGRGTLLSDVLRVFKKLGRICSSLSLHLVEASPVMRELQQRSLSVCNDSKNINEMGDSLRTKHGVSAIWYPSIEHVPKGFTFYLANEFFDALPIHQFQRTKNGWREVLVDVMKDDVGRHHLRFCLAPSSTPASVFIPENVDGDFVEIRPQAQVIAENMAKNMKQFGGSSLIIDYGDIHVVRNTLRAFKKHEVTDPLAAPGDSDITSNVDFSQIERAFTKHEISTFGPVTQRHFLKEMGIDVRKQVLLRRANSEEARNIESAYKMLTDDKEMGNCFKFFSAQRGTDKPHAF